MYNSTNIILSLMKEKGLKKAQLERECGLANGTIGNWQAGKSNPSYGSIVKISRYFNVSEEYILGIAHEKNHSESPQLSQEQLKFIKLFDSLTDDERKKLIDYAELLKRGRD